MRGFGYRKKTESSTLSVSGTERNEGVTIGVLLAPKAKHQTVLKKFCSVSFFDDHLHLMRYNMAAGSKRSNLFLFYLAIKLRKS